jgi:hypothetical protein
MSAPPIHDSEPFEKDPEIAAAYASRAASAGTRADVLLWQSLAKSARERIRERSRGRMSAAIGLLKIACCLCALGSAHLRTAFESDPAQGLLHAASLASIAFLVAALGRPSTSWPGDSDMRPALLTWAALLFAALSLPILSVPAPSDNAFGLSANLGFILGTILSATFASACRGIEYACQAIESGRIDPKLCPADAYATDLLAERAGELCSEALIRRHVDFELMDIAERERQELAKCTASTRESRRPPSQSEPLHAQPRDHAAQSRRSKRL